MKLKMNVENYRHAVAAVAVAICMAICGGVSAQTVSISPKTGNVISAQSYSTEQHEKGYGGAWVHNQLPLTLLTSDEATLTDNGLMKVHANNIKPEPGTGTFTISSGENEAVNHFTLSLPKGYRFTSYKIVMNSSTEKSDCGSTLREMNSGFTTSYKTASIAKSGSKNVMMQRTSLNATDMGNILYFRQDHDSNNGFANINIVSFVVTFECTDRFNEILRPDFNKYKDEVSCIAIPFQTQRIDLGQITQRTDNGYTSYKYNYNNVKDLTANFLFYDENGIVNGTAIDGTKGNKSIAAMVNNNNRTFLGLKNGVYWLETPTEATTQNGKNIPVGYRIVGARVVYSNNQNPDIKKGDDIYIKDNNGNYMNSSLDFTSSKVKWTYDTDGKVYTKVNGTNTYLRYVWRPIFSDKLETTTDKDDASSFQTDGSNLYYDKDHVVSYKDGKGGFKGEGADVVNADFTNTSETSFTINLYDKTGKAIEKTANVNKNNGFGGLVLEKINNDAIKLEVSGLQSNQLAYVCLEVQLEALNPYIDKMDIACTLPSGETKLKQQYLADDFTIGTEGKIDFAVPANYETQNLKFNFEGLNHKKADETYGDFGKQGEYSRYNFVKSEYYNLINENLQGNRDKAANYDYTKKTAVDMAGTKAFRCNNSDEFKAGTTGSKTFSYEEYRYSNSEYHKQGGNWEDIKLTDGSYKNYYLMVCDETRYNIAPTTTPRHAYYAYYSTSVKLEKENYEPVINYTKVYDNAMLESGYDDNIYSGATVTLKDKNTGNAIAEGTGYVSVKQIADILKKTDNQTDKPSTTSRILYLDLSKVKSVITSDNDAKYGKLADLKDLIGKNALIYLPQGISASLYNVATKAENGDDFNADNDIVLTDKLPFFAPYDIRMNADNEVVYTRTIIPQNNTKKWVSVVLPFTVGLDSESGSYMQEDGEDVFTFYKMNNSNSFSSTDKGYEINAHFSPCTGIAETEANKPYLINIDKIADARDADNIMFTLRQSGATITKTPATLDGETANGTVDGKSITLVSHGTYSGVKIAKEKGIFYFNLDKFVSSLNLSEKYTDVKVLPFRTYYDGNAGSQIKAIYISTEPNGTPTSIDNASAERQPVGFAFSTQNGMLAITAQNDMAANIRNMNGQLVESCRIKAGETRSVSLPSGVYIVNGTKVIVR